MLQLLCYSFFSHFHELSHAHTAQIAPSRFTGSPFHCVFLSDVKNFMTLSLTNIQVQPIWGIIFCYKIVKLGAQVAGPLWHSCHLIRNSHASWIRVFKFWVLLNCKSFSLMTLLWKETLFSFCFLSLKELKSWLIHETQTHFVLCLFTQIKYWDSLHWLFLLKVIIILKQHVSGPKY